MWGREGATARRRGFAKSREAAQGKGSMERCQSGLGIHRATVKTRDVSLPIRQHPLKSLLKIRTPECNPLRSPVLWSRGGGGKDLLKQERRKSWRLSACTVSPAREMATKSGLAAWMRGKGTTDPIPWATSSALRETGVVLRESPRSCVKRLEARTPRRTAFGALGRRRGGRQTQQS